MSEGLLKERIKELFPPTLNSPPREISNESINKIVDEVAEEFPHEVNSDGSWRYIPDLPKIWAWFERHFPQPLTFVRVEEWEAPK